MDPLSRLKEQTIRPETRIEYTIDLTRQYHNLLQKEGGGNTQSYLMNLGADPFNTFSPSLFTGNTAILHG